MSDLAASIDSLVSSQGVGAAMLVDRTTGLVYGRGGDASALPDAAQTCDETHLIEGALAAARAEGSLENITVTTSRSHYLTQVLPRARGDDLLAVVTLSRESTNLALALRQMQALARDVSA